MAAFNGGFVVETLVYGIPVVIVIAIIIGIYFWRKSKSKSGLQGTGSGALSGGNIALIMSPDRNFVVDMKEFYIHRETDPRKNVTATYALFPEEEAKMNAKGIDAIKERVSELFFGKQNGYEEEEEKKGRIFDETLAAIKKNGGWLTAYTLETNTQVPLLSKLDLKETIAIMERNVEKRMSILKAVHIASQQFAQANQPLEQFGNALKISAFAIVLSVIVLGLVIYSVPGSISSGVAGAVAAGVKSGFASAGGIASTSSP